MLVELDAYLTRDDIQRAGDFSQPVKLDYLGGLWWVMQRPVIDLWGRVSRVRIVSAGEVRVP